MFQNAIIIQINIAYRNIEEKNNETGKYDGRGKSNKAIREERELKENSVLGRVFRDCCIDSIYKFSHKINFNDMPLRSSARESKHGERAKGHSKR